MKESKTLIIGLVVFIFLVLVVAGTFFSGREVLFAEEPNEPNDLIFFIEDTSKEILTVSSNKEVTFTYCGEELILDVNDGVIFCNQPPEKAIEIIYKALYSCYGIDNDIDIDDLTVRFPEPNDKYTIYFELDEPEPNEPEWECKHENRLVCTVGGCECWTCMDCDEHSEGYEIYFKE